MAPLPAGDKVVNALGAPPAAPGYRWPGANPYTTPLSPIDEAKFRFWVEKQRALANNGDKGVASVVAKWQDVPDSDYDMRGFWQDLASQGAATSESKWDGAHLTDTYKTPYHRSFSRYSQYSPSDGPDWHGSDAAGWYLIDQHGRVVFSEPPKK
jgi:hypothetical protein